MPFVLEFVIHRNCRRLALVLALATIGSGCTKGPRASLSFGPTPRWHQDGSARDSVKTQGTAQANVPVPSKSEAESIAAADDTVGKSRVTVELPSDDFVIMDRESSGQIDALDSSPSTAHRLASVETPAPDARIQQLKAALTADVERSVDERERAVAGHPLRIRAESMLRRAEEFLRVGQLSEARRAAQQAVELTESGRFEFLPTEERPLDLLRRIEAAISRQETVPTPLESIVDSHSPTHLSEGAAAPGKMTPGHSAAIRPTPQTGWQSPADSETVLVAANRPVILAPVSNDDDEALAAEMVLMVPGDESGLRPALPDVMLSTVELPPFRGALSAGPFTMDGPALGSPESAPAPPDVEEPEPLPSLRASATAEAPPLTDESSTRPLFHPEALMVAAAALGLICCLTGAGLLVRHFRERI